MVFGLNYIEIIYINLNVDGLPIYKFLQVQLGIYYNTCQVEHE